MPACSRKLVLLSVIVASTAAQASAVRADTLTFEGLKNLEGVGNYYDGGTGSLGSGPGPRDGIRFDSSAEALIGQSGGGTGTFTNPPSPGDTVLFFESSARSYQTSLDDPGGFTTSLAFDYASSRDNGLTVSVYSGLDGTGTQLGTTALDKTPNPYTSFQAAGFDFAGTGRSVLFSFPGGAVTSFLFDNIQLKPAVTSTPLPTSGTAGVVLLGGVGLNELRRRRTAGQRPTG